MGRVLEEWMIEAVINDLELNQTRQYENNTALANAYVAAFITEQSWEDEVKFLNELRQISRLRRTKKLFCPARNDKKVSLFQVFADETARNAA